MRRYEYIIRTGNRFVNELMWQKSPYILDFFRKKCIVKLNEKYNSRVYMAREMKKMKKVATLL